MYLSIFILGLLVGGVASVLGLGGGVFIVPLLPNFTSLGPHEVIATSLMTIFCVVSLNTWFFHKKKLVNWRVVIIAGVGTAISAFASSRLAVHLSKEILGFLLAGFLFLFSLRVLLLKLTVVEEVKEKTAWAPCFIIGVVAGAISGLTGIGSGLLLGPLLMALSIVPNQKISPTSNGIMIFTTFFGVLGFLSQSAQLDIEAYSLGYIHFDIVFILFVGATTTAHWGRKYQAHLPAKYRKLILGLLLLGLALKVFASVV